MGRAKLELKNYKNDFVYVANVEPTHSQNKMGKQGILI